MGKHRGIHPELNRKPDPPRGRQMICFRCGRAGGTLVKVEQLGYAKLDGVYQHAECAVTTRVGTRFRGQQP